MNRIDPNIRAEILRLLGDIERKHHVRIIYACESGSRAWGFESKDSDYDVRFLYVRPSEWYLSIDVERKRDVIELPINDELDVNGWDLRKALELFRKSNPPLYEWLKSPIVYLERGRCAARMRERCPVTYNPIAAHYHYLRMAENNYRSHLRGRRVRRKKYLYVLRPLLAVIWIDAGMGVVPTEFDRLVLGTVDDADLLREIDELLRAKRAGREVDDGPRFPAIHAFIDQELVRHHEAPARGAVDRPTAEGLNELFRDVIDLDAPDQSERDVSAANSRIELSSRSPCEWSVCFCPTRAGANVDLQRHAQLVRILHAFANQRDNVVNLALRSFKQQFVVDLQDHPGFVIALA